MTNRNGVALQRTRVEFKLSETALGINLGTKSRSITDISRFVDSLGEYITFLVRTVQDNFIKPNRKLLVWQPANLLRPFVCISKRFLLSVSEDPLCDKKSPFCSIKNQQPNK